MAVEARHLNLVGTNRGFGNPIEGDFNMFGNQGIGTAIAAAAPSTYTSMIVVEDSGMKSESGVTYNNCNQFPLQRKRSRDCLNTNQFLSNSAFIATAPKSCGSFSFLGQDISLHIHQQQLHLDRLISLHMENVRSELEERRKRQAGKIMEAIELGMVKRLKAKEEEIVKMGKINWALQERVKSLCIENELWRDMAQSNEAAVNTLRANLEQVLCEVNRNEKEEAESSCSSNGGADSNTNTNSKNRMLCKRCGREESSVLLLPCRHLCVCSQCVSLVDICPVCKSTKNATLQVNMFS